ncbi:unnamed protein product [Microthlaspi erraticum]|uniref:Uncharacterized protein n=1 Tax=Microthlaspi erraticum TaxID=1685480 RepID=A0A6D2KVQ0_9BRAS|nr:unnamed protein product [Microthlaspi erraticum]
MAKNAWPELVGKNGDFAASVIERENNRVDAVVVLVGSPLTADFKCNRVRVIVDRNAKNAWPELVRKDGDFAAAVIERENRRVDAVVILVGSPATADFRCDRVRVWVDRNGIVVTVPVTG